jgi:hypothetical protein
MIVSMNSFFPNDNNIDASGIVRKDNLQVLTGMP